MEQVNNMLRGDTQTKETHRHPPLPPTYAHMVCHHSWVSVCVSFAFTVSPPSSPLPSRHSYLTVHWA